MLFNIKNFVSSINRSWINFKLQTQIILATTLLISILVSSIASWSVTTIQEQINVTNNRLTTDLNSLLSSNLISLLENNKSSEINEFCECFYENTPTIRYILFIEKSGLSYGIPYNYNEIFSLAEETTKNLSFD